MNTLLNGKPRKNLASQLDGLDSILDGLSEAIPTTVASAVEQAVAQAMRTVLSEVLTRPEQTEAAPAATAPAPASHPSPWRCPWNWCSGAVTATATATVQTTSTMVSQVGAVVSTVLRPVVQLTRKTTKAVRCGWLATLAQIRQSVQIARLLGVVGSALLGHAARVALNAAQGMCQALTRKAGTALTAAGPWILPAVLVLDLVRVVATFAGGPVLVLLLALACRATVSALLLALWRLSILRMVLRAC